MSERRVSTAIRFRPDLHAWLVDRARAEHLSLNQVVNQIVADAASGSRTLRDRDEWNDHLANEVSLHILAVPTLARGWVLRRVERLRRSEP